MTNTGNETRTRMVFPPMDFKSIASTIPPCQLDVHFCTPFVTQNSPKKGVIFVRRSKISQARLMGNAPINVEVKALCVYLFTTAHWLQLFVSWVSCQPNKEVMKNNCIWTRMLIERKEMNHTFRKYSDTVHPLRVERRIAGYKPGATYRITLGAYLPTHTTTMHIINSPFTSFADNL